MDGTSGVFLAMPCALWCRCFPSCLGLACLISQPEPPFGSSWWLLLTTTALLNILASANGFLQHGCGLVRTSSLVSGLHALQAIVGVVCQLLVASSCGFQLFLSNCGFQLICGFQLSCGFQLCGFQLWISNRVASTFQLCGFIWIATFS